MLSFPRLLASFLLMIISTLRGTMIHVLIFCYALAPPPNNKTNNKQQTWYFETTEMRCHVILVKSEVSIYKSTATLEAAEQNVFPAFSSTCMVQEFFDLCPHHTTLCSEVTVTSPLCIHNLPRLLLSQKSRACYASTPPLNYVLSSPFFILWGNTTLYLQVTQYPREALPQSNHIFGCRR